VLEFSELAQESTSQPAPAVLVVSRNDMDVLEEKKRLGLKQYMPAGEDHYVALQLPEDPAWRERMKNAFTRK
jgi:hypothetical protein